MRLILAAALPSKSLWYLTRGSGAVSLLLLTASLVLGVVTSVGAATESLPRFVVQALHRNISLLVTVFLAIHVATSVADSFVPITWVDALVPLHASYRPLWTGLGALAFDLLLALVITSLVRARGSGCGRGDWPGTPRPTRRDGRRSGTGSCPRRSRR